ncbi:hypothetical protein B0H19DRAFT_1130802 [Mycena capillaripes]|nr:hypothetical protein B0H19DRAFT_1130802 [Mycena capillaripes]
MGLIPSLPRFRDVIVGAPALWTIVEANLNAEGSVEILKLYLERSRACHICATLRRPTIGRINQILPHVHRMWRLRIVFRTTTGGLLLAPFRDISAPNLQHLELLTSLIMDGFKFQLPLPQWAASLTHLELRRGKMAPEPGGIRSVVAFTTQCQLLVHLHLDIRRHIPSTTRQLHIPLLKSLHLSVLGSEADSYLLVIGTHGNQIFALFNSKSVPSSFPALTSFSFVNRLSCSCETERSFSNPISAPSLGLFPALSTLALINQCFTTNLVTDILSLPWPLLDTLTLCPPQDYLVDVRGVLHDAVELKRRCGQPLPKLRLSLPLALPQEIGAEVEIFYPEDVLKLFRG